MNLEPLKVFLTQNVFTPLTGFTFGDWMRVLIPRILNISPRYWPRVFLMTIMSLQTSLVKRKDDETLSHAKVEVPDPVFILGHWRSGTTHLHNLMALDPQWSYPDFVAVTQPHGLLSVQNQIRESKLIRFFTPKTRLIDNMSVTLESPTEDEVALTLLTQLSPAMGFVFPQQAELFDPYLTFREVSTGEKNKWQQALKTFLKKLAIVSTKPVVLKSPPHTARIKSILEVFPKARFIHIHRDPYEVFSSYKRSSIIMLKMMTLQKPKWELFDDRILSQYRKMYDCFFEDIKLIPQGQFTEVSFRDLDKNPLPTLQKIYQDLGFKDFSILEVAAQKYLNGLNSFSKVSHTQLEPEIIKKINSSWYQSFERWGYPMRESEKRREIS